MGADAVWKGFLWAGLAAAPTQRRFVVVLLRGGMHGLAAVPAVGDPQWHALARGPRTPAGGPFPAVMAAAGRFLAAPQGARVAMCEHGGWDAHVNQMAPQGALSRNLAELDRGIAALRDGLGPLWSEAVVQLMSEFDRTVAPNGTQGSDHGVRGAAFLAGGAVQGGRVVADGPGLGPAQLHESRGLRATTDLRAVAMGVLPDHLAIDPARLEQVFPSRQRLSPFDGLVRA